MRQSLGFIAVWLGATVLATWVAWFGVRDVLRSEVVDDMRIEPLSAVNGRTGAAALPVGAPAEPTAGVGTPIATARSEVPEKPTRTRPPATAAPTGTAAPVSRATGSSPQTTRPPSRPTSSGSPRTRPDPAPEPTATRTSSAPRASASKAPEAKAAPDANVRVVNVKGGSVSFVIENGVCRLVSAAPNAGYETKVSQADGWIRVDLIQGAHGSSAFCIGHENRTDVWEF
ncbi:secreted protein [Planomonospora sphaerica]|uniref:Secreted protein n=1 Tax=Planomonospora sphaerica TaxID=161355 RepID=A0A171DGS2_9ACTN|nr:secreted protein [Planomonospora sphaerica]